MGLVLVQGVLDFVDDSRHDCGCVVMLLCVDGVEWMWVWLRLWL